MLHRREKKGEEEEEKKEKRIEEKRLTPEALNLGRGPSGVGAPPWPEPKLNALPASCFLTSTGL